jgi:hypothetical protein
MAGLIQRKTTPFVKQMGHVTRTRYNTEVQNITFVNLDAFYYAMFM